MSRLAWLLLTACSLRDPPSTIAPAAPLPADPPAKVDTMQVECDAMMAALETYKACTNLEPDEVRGIEGWIEAAQRNFAAGTKVHPEPNALTAMATACHRATVSVKAAHARCLAGPRPKPD